MSVFECLENNIVLYLYVWPSNVARIVIVAIAIVELIVNYCPALQDTSNILQSRVRSIASGYLEMISSCSVFVSSILSEFFGFFFFLLFSVNAVLYILKFVFHVQLVLFIIRNRKIGQTHPRLCVIITVRFVQSIHVVLWANLSGNLIRSNRFPSPWM